MRELALAGAEPGRRVACPTAARTTARCVRIVGEPPAEPPALDHATFAEAMGFVDAEHGAEVGGSRFAYVMREAVLLELALVQWVMGRLVAEGFVPVVPPVLVREHVMEEAGFFPTDRNQVYDLPEDELFLVGTSEVPLSALHRGELLDAGRAAASATPASPRTSGARRAPTARTRAASSGCTSSTRSRCSRYVAPADSGAEHERILAIEERIIGGLGLPYRVVNIAAGDLGAPAAKKFDIEVWLPSEGTYREVTSCSNYLRLLGPPAPDPGAGRARHRARAHAERHRVRDQPDARVPLRALPAGRRLLRRPRRPRSPSPGFATVEARG